MKKKQEKKVMSKDVFTIANGIIKDEKIEDYEQEVSNIIKTYCQVEDIKVPRTFQTRRKSQMVKKQQKQRLQAQNSKNTSEYSKKIKETLRQINANRNKDRQLMKGKIEIDGFNYKNNNGGVFKEEISLKNNSVGKMIKTICKPIERINKEVMKNLLEVLKRQQIESDKLIYKWKIKRIFEMWKSETILIKIQKERKRKLETDKLEKAYKMADSFRQFILVKNYLKMWKIYTKKSIHKKLIKKQQQQLALQILLEEDKNHKKQPKIQNQHLQNKLRGFLDGLKNQIQNKNDQNRLKTIKQYTQESKKTQQYQSQQQSNINLIVEQQQSQEHDSHQEQNIIERANNVNSQLIVGQPKRPLTNQQLQQRRKQLANKSKARKQGLQRLRKQKQSKRQQEERQRKQIQKQVQMEQKKRKQQQYRQFLRQKRQQEEWEKRQLQLNEKAQLSNRLRLLKYYGLQNWKRLHLQLQKHTLLLNHQIKIAALRMNFKPFCLKLKQKQQAVTEVLFGKMEKYYQKQLKKKAIVVFKANRILQLQRKQQYQIRHDVYTLKIYLKEWIRVHPFILLQNQSEQRPKIKRAEQLRGLTLLNKGLRGLILNKDQEQKDRNINSHKDKIKDQIKDWLNQGSGSINIQDFL